MLDAVAAWITAQLAAEHVRAAERALVRVAPGAAGLIENAPPVEEVTAAQLARFRARLRRELPAAARREAPGRRKLILQLTRDSVPVVKAVRAARLTGFYLPDELMVLVVGGGATGRTASLLAGTPPQLVWEPPGAASFRP